MLSQKPMTPTQKMPMIENPDAEFEDDSDTIWAYDREMLSNDAKTLQQLEQIRRQLSELSRLYKKLKSLVRTENTDSPVN